MLYEEAIEKCKEIADIIKYFKDNNLINCQDTESFDLKSKKTHGNEVTLIGFDKSVYNHRSEYQEDNYFVYNVINDTLLHVDNDGDYDEDIHDTETRIESTVGYSTEEVYFQGSTLYNANVLFAMCLIDYLRIHVGYSVYFDFEYIDEIRKIYKKHQKKMSQQG